MLSDEEMKAIDNIKSLLLYSKEHEYFSPFQEQEIDDMNIVLNIVEKQSKEIEEAEQKERKAYIDGTNVAHELCNKKWEDKIKAKIEEVQKRLKEETRTDFLIILKILENELESLLEKE